MVYNLINIVGIIFEIYILNLYFSKISELQVSKIKQIIFALLYIALQCLNNYVFLTKTYFSSIIALVFMLLFSFSYKINLSSRFFSVIFIVAILVLSEYITAMLITSITKVSVSYTQTNMFLFMICTLISKFIALSIIQILKYDKKRRINWLPTSLAFNFFPIMIATMFVLILMFEYIYIIDDLKLRILTLIASVTLIVCNVFIFYVIDKQNDLISTKERLKFAQAQINTQIEHYTELYNYQNELRTFRHDIKNRDLSLISLMNSENYDEAKKLLNKDVCLLDNKNIVNSSNPIIDSIIQSKLNIAQKSGIEIETYFKLSKPIQIDPFELGVLIGNALDNAIEATEKISKELQKPILLKLFTLNEHLIFIIENSTLENIDTNNISSTKLEKHNHGYGLKSIKTIVEKYNGAMDISCNNNIFKLDINLINE